MGFSIGRIGEAPEKCLKGPCDSPLVRLVEVIGAPGSGKTTLLISARNRLREDWYLDECLAEIPYDADRSCSNSKIRTQLLELEFRRIQSDINSAAEQALSLRHRCDVMNSDIFMMNGVFRKRFVLSEGFSHNFGASMLKHFEGSKIDGEKFMAGRAFVVLLSNTPSVVAERILRRRREGSGYTYGRLSGPKLVAAISAANELREEFSDMAEKFGCPVIKLSANTGIDHNSVRLVEFCKKVSSLR